MLDPNIGIWNAIQAHSIKTFNKVVSVLFYYFYVMLRYVTLSFVCHSYQTTSYLLNIGFIFDMCNQISAAATPVKGVCDSKELSIIFRNIIKLPNGASVAHTPALITQVTLCCLDPRPHIRELNSISVSANVPDHRPSIGFHGSRLRIIHHRQKGSTSVLGYEKSNTYMALLLCWVLFKTHLETSESDYWQQM